MQKAKVEMLNGLSQNATEDKYSPAGVRPLTKQHTTKRHVADCTKKIGNANTSKFTSSTDMFKPVYMVGTSAAQK